MRRPRHLGGGRHHPDRVGRRHFPGGLAYDEERDLFFVMAAAPHSGPKRWYRTLTGVDHPDPGREVASCRDKMSSLGLAWDPATRSLWTNGAGSLRQIDPMTCTAISNIAPKYTSAGRLFRVSDVDADGDVLSVFAYTDMVSDFVATDPRPTPVPWLSLSPSEGTIDPRRSQRIGIDVDESQLPEGVEQFWVVLRGNGGPTTRVVVPVSVSQ